jgi:hypothetical protein
MINLRVHRKCSFCPSQYPYFHFLKLKIKEHIFVKIGTGGSAVKGILQFTGLLNKLYLIFLKCIWPLVCTVFIKLYSLTKKKFHFCPYSFFITSVLLWPHVVLYQSQGTVVHNLNAWQNTDGFPIRHSYFVHLQLWYTFYWTTREKWLILH